MARLDIAIEHGQAPEVAYERFQEAVREVQSRLPEWIGRLDCSPTGRSMLVTSSYFQVRCWFDERAVHVQGSVPLTLKLMEGTLRGQVEREIQREMPVASLLQRWRPSSRFVDSGMLKLLLAVRDCSKRLAARVKRRPEVVG